MAEFIQYKAEHVRSPTESVPVNQLFPPAICQIIRVPAKILKKMKAAVCSFFSQSSTNLFFRMKTPTVRPTKAPKA